MDPAAGHRTEPCGRLRPLRERGAVALETLHRSAPPSRRLLARGRGAGRPTDWAESRRDATVAGAVAWGAGDGGAVGVERRGRGGKGGREAGREE